jgi:phenolic acid decarboxylase
MAKAANYFERTCTGTNHSLQLFANEATQQVDMIKFSLNPRYTIFLEINFASQKSRISCLKKGETSYIAIPKMLIPDFPDLVNLKEKISMYVTFS